MGPASALPAPLPHCPYPTAAETAQHGLQPLPPELPVVDLAAARPYRSGGYTLRPLIQLGPDGILETARVVGDAFARREPQCRHLRPAAAPPAGLLDAEHVDAFGRHRFGAWDRPTLLRWFVRLMILTDATAPRGAVTARAGALEQSLAIVGVDGRVLGGAINETLPSDDHPLREGDPFLDAVLGFAWPVGELLGAQSAAAVAGLAARYPDFRTAHAAGRVGHHYMVARDDALPSLDAFELVAGMAAHYRALGFAYVVVEATNCWTGAACEVLGGIRVHYAPFRARPVVPASPTPLPGTVTSPDGYVAAKDAGSMYYVLRLA